MIQTITATPNTFVLSDPTIQRDTRRILLYSRSGTVRGWALVDQTDFERLNAYRWFLDSHGYAKRKGKSQGVFMHREVLGLHKGDGKEIDHINRDKLDNRRTNLRIVTHAQNAQNVSKRPSRSRYRGVEWDAERERWRARVRHEGKDHKLGRFDDEREAALAAAQFRAKHLPYSHETLI